MLIRRSLPSYKVSSQCGRLAAEPNREYDHITQSGLLVYEQRSVVCSLKTFCRVSFGLAAFEVTVAWQETSRILQRLIRREY